MNTNQTTVTAIFDGEVLRPEVPLDLEPNTRYVVTIRPDHNGTADGNAWDVLERFAGAIEAPSDWSEEHDHYLHGTEKRARNESGA